MSKNIKQIIKYLICISIVFLSLFIITNIFDITPKEKSNVTTSIISDNNEKYSIYVEYPRFHNDKINTIVTNKIYSYIKEFKKHNDNNKVLDITYELYYFKDYLNITFHIENTLSKIKNQNILIDLTKDETTYITNIYDKDYLSNTINNHVQEKYSNKIYSEIKNSTINNFTYIISDNKIDVYFNNIKIDNNEEIPYITIDIETQASYHINDNSNKKFMAFTYDDGPSEYTSKLLKILENNNSSATFFMLGNRMKNYEELIRKIHSSNSEIGSHTYSHKDLTSISKDEINNELNSTNIIYNALTGQNLKYLRPPYNKYDENTLNQNYHIISWNIDTKDWLLKDSAKIYNSVISQACDGCIVIMHDIYPETIEATEKLIPKLKEMGYEITSISKLAQIKNYNFEDKTITTKISDD